MAEHVKQGGKHRKKDKSIHQTMPIPVPRKSPENKKHRKEDKGDGKPH